ncbi:MAG TPA: O-antigen ligase family protein [Gammaproteobacteria bacterium]|nr:O-antigen ligase family protein [Gammaproteobacteria bacterium]
MTLYTQFQQTYSRSRPYLLLAGYLCLVASAFLSPLTISGTDAAILAASVFCLLSGKLFIEFKLIRTHPITLSILILLAIVFAGMFWSIASWHDRWGAFHKYLKLGYFILILPLCTERRWREHAISAFLLTITVTVALSYLTKYTPLHLGKTGSPQFIFHSHIETSYFVAFSTYVLVQRALYGQHYRWLCWLLAAIFTFHEFFINDGRTGWMVYFGLMILFFMQQALAHLDREADQDQYTQVALRSLLFGIIAILLLGILIYNLSASFHNRVNSLLPNLLPSHHSQQINAKGHALHKPDLRISFFKYSLVLTREHPIMGMGTASFQATYKKTPVIPGWGTLNNPHNEYLLILVQGGLVGLGALLYFFYTQWYASFRLTDERHIAQALTLSAMISCSFNAFIYTSSTGHFYVLFLGLLFAQYKPAKNKVNLSSFFK